MHLRAVLSSTFGETAEKGRQRHNPCILLCGCVGGCLFYDVSSDFIALYIVVVAIARFL